MERLNFNVLPLQDMAVRRVVSVLFKEPDILASVRDFPRKSLYPFDKNIEAWRKTVGNKMSGNILKIGLPASLTKQLIDTSTQMGRQILGWKGFHEEYLSVRRRFREPILERLCWTAAGVLDYRKTAEELIRSDVIGVVGRYQLASLYCLEDWIPLLWNELPEEKKLYFYDEKRHLESRWLPLQFSWPYIIKGELSKLYSLTRSYRRKLVSLHQFAFEESVEMPNKAAAEFFFQKLTQEEKEASLIPITKNLLAYRNCYQGVFPKEKVSEMLRYLLSVMTPDQQMRIFHEHAYTVLRSFVDWPCQDQFSEIADLVWNFLPESDYNSFLREMYERLRNSGYYFQMLFQEFFLRIPCDFRKRFMDRQCESGSYFARVLHLEDKEALETTFRCVDAATRAGILFSGFAFDYFRSSISRGRWDVVAVCLREARLSKEDRERLKEAFTGYLTLIGLGEKELKTRKWTRFFQFLDETDAPSKRCSEDETPTEAKMKKT
ncbi:hypothetical protein AVEN_46934-1 [Araneus ventricosus]|uniref:Uncharacterized protein n=1 Tax=Araneus ventricosus TaxID=182803 RepID=A0A4Y2FJH0_ARAVE|nr:hypothetical protein AVEN_46934-1 [Araneus ventricosus]